ncbi:MAG TPA: hypothetical protein VGI57_00340 [Usitatibacter sp.]
MAYRIDVVANSAAPREDSSPICWIRIIFSVILLLGISVQAADGPGNLAPPHASLEYRGAVLDYETRQPVEGAYIVASYYIRRADPSGQTNWCIKTRGMYTGADGKYWFPVEERNGLSPLMTSAIKPGYAYKTVTQIDSDVWRKQDQVAYDGHDIFLVRQDEKKPDLRFGGDQGCWHAEVAEAAAAGVQFLRIELEEYKKYNGSEQTITAITEEIAFFERLPRQSDVSKSRGWK